MNNEVSNDQHLSDDFVRAYLEGGLANAQAYLQVEEHLRHCAVCAEKVKNLVPVQLTVAERLFMRTSANPGPTDDELVDFARDDTTLSEDARTLIESSERYQQEAKALHSFIDSMTESDWAEVNAIKLPETEETKKATAAVNMSEEKTPFTLSDSSFSSESPKSGFFDWLRSTLLSTHGIAYSGGLAVLLIIGYMGIHNFNVNDSKVLGGNSNGIKIKGGKSVPTIDSSIPKTNEDVKILVDSAVSKAIPALAFLKDSSQAISDAFSPASSVIRESKPQFEWNASENSGTVYRVKLYEAGENVPIKQSDLLTETTWQIDENLKRGQVYEWQVLLYASDKEQPLSRQRLRFKVLDSQSYQSLEAMEARWEEMPLKRAIFYLEHGMLIDLGKVSSELSVEEQNALRGALQEISDAK